MLGGAFLKASSSCILEK